MVDLKKKLTPEQHHVLFEKGTEAPFTGKYLDMKKAGMYTCAYCGSELFSSETKFESGTGWPSFYDVAKSENVKLKDDLSHGMNRIEVTCANCGGHLGHVFDDGPSDKTGKRYCINSCALGFESRE
jgi:peptide-methionine (R)-S-oxide reductase